MRRIDVASLDAGRMALQLLAELAQHGMPKVVFGGNHLVSYPIMAAYAKSGGRRILVLDAHHDGYVVPQLTHYSHFHHLVELFDLEITIVGCRYEVEKADPRLRFLSISDLPGYLQAGGRLYVPVDLDVLDPQSFPSVNHPVPDGLSLCELQWALELVFSNNPDCVDLVEPSLSKHCTKESLEVLTSLVRAFVAYGQSRAVPSGGQHDRAATLA